eukprot:319829_1
MTHGFTIIAIFFLFLCAFITNCLLQHTGSFFCGQLHGSTPSQMPALHLKLLNLCPFHCASHGLEYDFSSQQYGRSNSRVHTHNSSPHAPSSHSFSTSIKTFGRMS